MRHVETRCTSMVFTIDGFNGRTVIFFVCCIVGNAYFYIDLSGILIRFVVPNFVQFIFCSSLFHRFYFWCVLFNFSLLEPSSRRPLMFSQSTDNMGLTDIEMTQFDYEDPYYDERQYEVEYEVRGFIGPWISWPLKVQRNHMKSVNR